MTMQYPKIGRDQQGGEASLHQESLQHPDGPAGHHGHHHLLVCLRGQRQEYVRENGEQMADVHQLGSGLCLHHRPLLLLQHPKKDSIQLHLLFLGVFTVCGQQAEAEEIAKKTQHQGFSQ